MVIADEAHRTQYDFIDGYARHMRDALPKASFIGFTGTPIELTDKNTRAVFGDYISIYDIERAVEDKCDRAGLLREPAGQAGIETAGGQTGEEFRGSHRRRGGSKKEKLKRKWAAAGGPGRRRERGAANCSGLGEPFRAGLEAMEGKGMVVCMSRRICIELYNQIVKLRPGWHDPDDARGTSKMVLTGSATTRPNAAAFSQQTAA